MSCLIFTMLKRMGLALSGKEIPKMAGAGMPLVSAG